MTTLGSGRGGPCKTEPSRTEKYPSWQLWLLSATLESFLAGHRETALPAAIVSGVMFLACLGLYLFVERLDKEARKQ